MSNFAIGVGGSGAKLMQSLVHLGASGLFPSDRRMLHAVLVDPDENNGNVTDCTLAESAYQECRRLSVGKTDLFSANIILEGPWTPKETHPGATTLEAIFHYDQLVKDKKIDADLLELLFERDELDMPITQGFRGRPAIGATVFANGIDFSDEDSIWGRLAADVGRSGQSNPRAILAGSVFGGSGASGVPTIVRLLEAKFQQQLPNLGLALVLLLPYFQFEAVPDEPIQADPANFPAATAEALNYYHDQDFLSFCSIVAAGEEVPAMMAKPAIGAADQRNDPHFIELVAGLGAIQFFSGNLDQNDSKSLFVAGRQADGTLTWDDLPFALTSRKAQVTRLQKMAVFAVAFNYIFYPMIAEVIGGTRDRKTVPFWMDHVVNAGINPDEAATACATVSKYLRHYLNWLVHLSSPRRNGFEPGLVDPHVFAILADPAKKIWRLKTPGSKEFNDDQFGGLLRNTPVKRPLDTRTILNRAGRNRVDDAGAVQGGRLVRALYDACSLD